MKKKDCRIARKSKQLIVIFTQEKGNYRKLMGDGVIHENDKAINCVDYN